MNPRRGWPLVALLGLLAPVGCTRDHSRITPTTSGTDLRTMPRGRMTPLPFPGSSLAHAGDRTPKTDPATVTATTRDAIPTR